MENKRSAENKEHSLHQSLDTYHVVSIRHDLPRVTKSYPEETRYYSPPDAFWLSRLRPSSANKESPTEESTLSTEAYDIHYSRVNGPCELTFQVQSSRVWSIVDTSSGDHHPVLTAFLRAYNSHEDVILSPDDIWLMICIYFAQYVNHNLDELAHLYLDDQTSKVLTIENEETDETEWERAKEQ